MQQNRRRADQGEGKRNEMAWVRFGFTLLAMSFVFDAFDRMAEQVGLPAMQFRFGVCLLSVIPLGLLHRCLPTYPGRNLHKHAYSALAGLFQSILVYEWTSLHMILGTLVTYLLMILFRKNCGWIVTVAAIIHVTIGYVSLIECGLTQQQL